MNIKIHTLMVLLFTFYFIPVKSISLEMQHNLYITIIRNDHNKLKKLIKEIKEKDPEIPIDDIMVFKSPLFHLIIEKKFVEGFITFLKSGTDINKRDNAGETPLMPAIKVALNYGDNETFFLERLLQVGADVNIPTNKGQTPLMRAVYFGDENIIKMLLEYGADIDAKDKYNKDVYFFLKKRNLTHHKDKDIDAILEILEEYKKTNTFKQ